MPEIALKIATNIFNPYNSPSLEKYFDFALLQKGDK